MINTAVSLAIAAYFLWYPVPEIHLTGLAFLLVMTASLPLALFLVLSVAAWLPFVKLENSISSGAIALANQLRLPRVAQLFIPLFFLLTLLFAADIALFQTVEKGALLATWIVLLGTALDLLFGTTRQIAALLNPSQLILQQLAQAKAATDREALSRSIEAVTETAFKGLRTDSLSLARQAIEATHPLCTTLFAKKLPEEQLNHALFFLFERLEILYQKAASSKMQPICTSLLSTLGKIGLEAAKAKIELMSYPLHYLGRLAIEAQNTGMDGVANHALLTFLEIERFLIEELELKDVSLKEPSLTILDYMDKLSKKSFKRDKSMKIALLCQPFETLKKLFNSPRAADLPDRNAIVQSIDHILSEFQALEAVLKNRPTSQKGAGDSTSNQAPETG